MHDFSLYEKANIPDKNFPIRIGCIKPAQNSVAFHSHWHEHLELLYMVRGEACAECNSVSMHAAAGDLIVVNSNELHYAHSLGSPLEYYCIIIDPAFFKSGFIDTCEIKYIAPIHQNLILFQNKISGDLSVEACINSIIREHSQKEVGYELAIKSHVNWLLVLLLRNHVRSVLTPRESSLRDKNLLRLNTVLKYIEENSAGEISVNSLARMACVSKYHFCRLFKNATGKTVTEYVNHVRISKAESLLKNSSMNITEIALATGFNDANYFSRVFKKIKRRAPSAANTLHLDVEIPADQDNA